MLPKVFVPFHSPVFWKKDLCAFTEQENYIPSPQRPSICRQRCWLRFHGQGKQMAFKNWLITFFPHVGFQLWLTFSFLAQSHFFCFLCFLAAGQTHSYLLLKLFWSSVSHYWCSALPFGLSQSHGQAETFICYGMKETWPHLVPWPLVAWCGKRKAKVKLQEILGLKESFCGRPELGPQEKSLLDVLVPWLALCESYMACQKTKWTHQWWDVGSLVNGCQNLLALENTSCHMIWGLVSLC